MISDDLSLINICLSKSLSLFFLHRYTIFHCHNFTQNEYKHYLLLSSLVNFTYVLHVSVAPYLVVLLYFRHTLKVAYVFSSVLYREFNERFYYAVMPKYDFVSTSFHLLDWICIKMFLLVMVLSLQSHHLIHL